MRAEQQQQQQHSNTHCHIPHSHPPSLTPSLLPCPHAQIASERKEAQDSLHEAITALTAARSTVAALEAEAKDTSPR